MRKRFVLAALACAAVVSVPASANAYVYQGFVEDDGGGWMWQECITASVDIRALNLVLSPVKGMPGYYDIGRTGRGEAKVTAKPVVDALDPCEASPAEASTQLSVSFTYLSFDTPELVLNPLGRPKPKINFSYQSYSVGSRFKDPTSHTSIDLTLHRPPLPDLTYTRSGDAVWGTPIELTNDAENVENTTSCLPPSFVASPDYSSYRWRFIRFGKPDAGVLDECRMPDGDINHTPKTKTLHSLRPAARRAVERLYGLLDKQRAMYQFERGYGVAADILVEFPPSYQPDLRKYQAAARAAGLRPPTKTHPFRVSAG